MLRDSKITIHNADLDIEGTYPSVQQATNACKQTTIKEIIRIEGLSELEQRQLGINLSGGIVNANEFCVMALGAPTQDELLRDFLADIT